MKETEAQGIADLINSRNELSIKLNVQEILNNNNEYIFDEKEGKIAVCVRCKNVQWYQFEICHLSVNEIFEGEGLAYEILQKAENYITEKGGRIIQCTIRSNNERSIKLFTKNGYKEVNQFFNPSTGNYVNIYQKVISKNLTL